MTPPNNSPDEEGLSLPNNSPDEEGLFSPNNSPDEEELSSVLFSTTVSQGANVDNVNNINTVECNIYQTFKVDYSEDRQTSSQQHNLTEQELRSRSVLIDKVKRYWIEQVLEKSLYKNYLISIGFRDSPDAVEHPYSSHKEFSDEPQPTLNTKTNDVLVPMRPGQTLLILGEPGAGKTTILLKLLEELIKKNQEDSSKPIPIVLSLSSWTSRQNSFAEWLEKELNSKYDVDINLAHDWVIKKQLILLLDGLDEVQEKHRKDCIQKINIFKQEHGVTEIVLCSRIKEYKALPERLKLQRAIHLQSLTREEIARYLNEAGEGLEALKKLLREDSVLRQLSKTPLILSIMIQAYKNTPISELPQTDSLKKSRKEWSKHLFNAYINRMLKRRAENKTNYQGYEDNKSIHWLTWLAIKMKENQSIFQIEQIQPNWLQSKTHQTIYRIVVGLIVGLILGLIAGIYFIFYYELIMGKPHTPQTPQPNIQVIVLVTGVLSGLISGPFMGILSVLTNKFLRGVISGIIFAMTIFLLLYNLINEELLNTYIPPICLAGIFGGYLCTLMRENIQPADTIKIEPKKLIIYLILSFCLGILYVRIHCAIAPQLYQQKTYYWVFELIIIVIVGGFIGAFRIKKKEVNPQQARPNQGIRRSVKYAVISFASLVPSAALVVWLVDSVKNPIYLIYIGLTLGLMGGLGANEGSGIVSIQHFTLRVILWCQGYIPWNYARFLDYATERIFLQKIGGGYIFIHRMLLEHFAQMKR